MIGVVNWVRDVNDRLHLAPCLDQRRKGHCPSLEMWDEKRYPMVSRHERWRKRRSEKKEVESDV